MSAAAEEQPEEDKEGASLQARALHILRAHPQISYVAEPAAGALPRAFTVEIGVHVPLPNAWLAEGASPNGVRAIEPVTLRFFSRYPLMAPQPELRADFDRALAHVMPAGLQKPPIPCIHEGKTSELLQQRGLGAIIDQLVSWLEKAALNKLIDPSQGWEPVRRDSLDDYVVADSAKLRAKVTDKGGYQAHRLDWVQFLKIAGEPYHTHIGTPMTLHPERMDEVFKHGEMNGMATGQSVALIVWPGKDKAGKRYVADKYQPETVTDIASLKARAADYGCKEGLRSALDWFTRCIAGKRGVRTWPVVILLLARRPFALIGSDSSIELCPYLVQVSAPVLLGEGDATTVVPIGHREAVTPSLLRRMSADTLQDTPRWTLLGAGSVGSKLAMHMGRCGRNPSMIVDSASLTPHNAARHGLFPQAGLLGLPWIGPKATSLAEALEGLGPKPDIVVEDFTEVVQDEELRRKLLPPKAWGVVNATASLVVRQALSMVPSDAPRVIETALMAEGSVGLMTVEGPRRNPGTVELFAELYETARQDPVLGAKVFSAQDALRPVRVGDGCGSMTMAMSDAVLSTMTAPIATCLTRLQQEGLPDRHGMLYVGTVSPDKMSVAWKHYEVPPYLRLVPEDGTSWSVNLSARARKKIEVETARYRGVETGGILLGTYSETSRSFIVVDVMDAPPDSKRSPSEFVLGTKGVHAALAAYGAQTNHCLLCLGTWHSHLGDFGASPKDKATAAVAAIARLAPSVFLIRTPKGYRAVIADGADCSDLLDEYADDEN